MGGRVAALCGTSKTGAPKPAVLGSQDANSSPNWAPGAEAGLRSVNQRPARVGVRQALRECGPKKKEFLLVFLSCLGFLRIRKNHGLEARNPRVEDLYGEVDLPEVSSF